ncbi:hypothetical protein [Paenibacillus bovis]|uniref:Uncharacterized protein n=1 Tax=Paenibacillus bovis TaxID=1616788 RepID=A0A172ZF73_9BACL|nr:hypothetical protein [Paenibacillus bovis]ANF96304.1 hypothetical protein AR543_10020 [Paenibacillus bovis]
MGVVKEKGDVFERENNLLPFDHRTPKKTEAPLMAINQAAVLLREKGSSKQKVKRPVYRKK